MSSHGIPPLPDLNLAIFGGWSTSGAIPITKPADVLLGYAAHGGTAAPGVYPATRRCRARSYFETGLREVQTARVPLLSASPPTEAAIVAATRPGRRALLDEASDRFVADVAVFAAVRLAHHNLRILADSCAEATPLLASLLTNATSADTIHTLEDLEAWRDSVLSLNPPLEQPSALPLPSPLTGIAFLDPNWSAYERVFKRAADVIVTFDFEHLRWRPVLDHQERRERLVMLCTLPHEGLPPLEIARRYFARLREDSAPPAIRELQALTRTFAEGLEPATATFRVAHAGYHERLVAYARVVGDALAREGRELEAELEAIRRRRDELELRRLEVEAAEREARSAADAERDAAIGVQRAAEVVIASEGVVDLAESVAAAAESRLEELRTRLLGEPFRCPHGDTDPDQCLHTPHVQSYWASTERALTELHQVLSRHAAQRNEVQRLRGVAAETRQSLCHAKAAHVASVVRRAELAASAADARSAHTADLLELQDLSEVNARESAGWEIDDRTMREALVVLSDTEDSG